MIILALFVFQQIPVTFADTTWTMYGATLENTHYQKMVGAMETEPYVKWSYVTGDWVECYGAAVADVDGDGSMEVVTGSYDKKVYCLNGATGLVEWSYPTGDYVICSPAVADVDGDDSMEVVIGSWDSKIYCLNGVTGLVEWSYRTGATVRSAPAMVDIDGDDTMEVVIGSNDDKIYCLNGVTGLVEWSYPTLWVESSLAVADVNGDGTMEVVIGGVDQKVFCLNGVTGLVEWSYPTGGDVHSSPTAADVDGDGEMEVVVGSNDKKVYCLNGITGLVEWSYPTGGGVMSSPAVADLDGDGEIEVVIGSNDGKTYCLNGLTGLVKWSYNGGGWVHRGISVADLDGDVADECNLEVLVPNGMTDSLTCLNGEDGSVLWVKELALDVHDITIADIDNDGCVELIVGTYSDYRIWAFDDVGDHSDCECSPNSVEERHDEQQAGCLSHRDGVEFKVLTGGTGKMPVLLLFTSNAVEVDIGIYDACGRLKQVLYKGVLTKGGHTFMPDTKGKGIYFAVLRTQKSKKSLKITRF